METNRKYLADNYYSLNYNKVNKWSFYRLANGTATANKLIKK